MIIVVFIVTCTSAFAEAGADCNTEDARCSAYEVDVNTEVLKSFDFEHLRTLDLGQITKGETVVVAGHNFVQERGKSSGLVYLRYSHSS